VSFPLPPSLDTGAAEPLRQTLLAMIERREPMLLDGAAVDRAGQACLQVLVAGRRAAAAAGLGFAIAAPSAALAEMAQLARLDADLFAA
jgi:chemotaxis protein CheX